MSKSVLSGITDNGDVKIAANGYGPIDCSYVYVVIRDGKVVVARSLPGGQRLDTIYHGCDGDNWEAVAKALLIFYGADDPGFYEILDMLDRNCEEYTSIVKAVRGILMDEISEYSSNNYKGILTKL